MLKFLFLTFAALLLSATPSQAQTAPDLSDAAIGYQAEMTLTHSSPLVCTPASSGASPFSAPDWNSQNCSGGGGWTYTHDALDFATCVAAIPDMIAMQLAWERIAQIKAGVAPIVFGYDGDCLCKGGGTTGC